MVLEIGPGIGCLTQELAERYRRVVAVEIDRGLIPILNRTMADFDNVTVINDDIMKVDIETEVNSVVGNEQQSEELVKYLMDIGRQLVIKMFLLTSMSL